MCDKSDATEIILSGDSCGPFTPRLDIHVMSDLVRMIESKLHRSIVQVYGSGFLENQFVINSITRSTCGSTIQVDFTLPGMFDETFIWHFNERTLLEERNKP